MARNFTGAATDKVATTLGSNSNLRSYGIWTFRSGDGGGNLGRMFQKGTSGSTVNFNSNAGSDGYDFNRTFSPTSGVWGITPRPTANVWHHLLITYDSSSTSNLPLIYLNGVSQTVVIGTTPSGTRTDNAEVYNIGNRGDNNNRNWGGDLAEFAIWDRILSDGEAAALGKGYSPLFLLQGLVEYVPMVRDLVSRKNAAPTATGTTISVHPRIIYPSAVQARRFSTAAAPPAGTWPGYVSAPGGYF